jgi:hypothetical protein
MQLKKKNKNPEDKEDISIEMYHLENEISNMLVSGTRERQIRLSSFMADRFAQSKFQWNQEDKAKHIIRNAMNIEFLRDLIHVVNPDLADRKNSIWEDF